MVKGLRLERVVRIKKRSDTSKGGLKVNDMIISDEFILAKHTTSSQDLIKQVVEHPGEALLIKKGEKVIGVVTEHTILSAILKDNVELPLPSSALMSRAIVEVNENDTLEDILPELRKTQPSAVIVTDDEGNFKGYFSRTDWELASTRLKFYKRP